MIFFDQLRVAETIGIAVTTDPNAYTEINCPAKDSEIPKSLLIKGNKPCWDNFSHNCNKASKCEC